MNEKSHIKGLYERIRRLTCTLRKRYKRNNDFYIGILAMLSSHKLLRGYYRKHTNDHDLIEWRDKIFEIMDDFKTDLSKYEIKEQKRSI